jgi:hypothetical protein
MNILRRRPLWLSALLVIARFLAGRDLDGLRRTNASFLRHADKDLTQHGRATRWAHRRHAERAAIRLAALAAALAVTWGALWHRAATILTAEALVSVALALALWRGTVAARRASHMRRVVRPLYRTIAPLAALPVNDNPGRYLDIGRDYKTNPRARVRLTLNQEWEGNAAQQRAVTNVVMRRLTGDWDADYQAHAWPPVAVFSRSPEPPKRVTLADFAKVIDTAADYVLSLGFGSNNSVTDINLDSEAPHIALSMGTGGGKSDTVAGIIAQLVRKGCRHIDVIDPKRVSHNWARGLPGVTIHRYVQQQMEAIHRARLLMDSRYDALDADDSQVFDRHVIIIEEQNSLITDLNQYWEDYRRELDSQERGTTPRKNPAIADLLYILNKGRQCRINVVSIFQRMSAAATGGGDARENYGCKILARFSHQTWKILVGTTPIPRSSKVPGRAIFVLGDDSHAVQRVYAGIAKPDGSADREGIARLRAFALNGAEDTYQPQPQTIEVIAGQPEPEILVTLREACDSEVIRAKYGAARKARQRDSEFPAGQERNGVTVYDPAALAAWEANRLRAGKVATAA